MLIGEYIHSLDPKKRLLLPAKFRKEVGKKVVVTKGLENCLFVFPESEWKNISGRLNELPFGQADSRGFGRFMFSGATEIEVDSVGRILIPDFLRNFARLSNKVVVAGVHSRIEIWNERSWNEYKRRIEKEADSLAEKLGDIGVL